MKFDKLNISDDESSSLSPSIHLDDIPEDSPLYGHLQAYFASPKKKDIFACIAKEEDNDDIKSYEKLPKKK